MIDIELKAAETTLTDASVLFDLVRYQERKEGKIVRPVLRTWDEMRREVTPEKVKEAIRLGDIPSEWRAEWQAAYKGLINKSLRPAWSDAMEASAEKIAKRVNLLSRKDFSFDLTKQAILAWLESRGGALIVELTDRQFRAVNAVLQQYVVRDVLSPYELAKRIRPAIGLTRRESLAVVRFNAALEKEGLAADLIAKQVERYAAFLHRARGSRIARTEISFAYNRGQLESIRQAVSEGWLNAAEVVKSWLTAFGERTCEECAQYDGETVGLEETFSNGLLGPPLHPYCRCGVSYKVIRR